MAPLLISAAIGLAIFGAANLQEGTGLMLNWAECVGIAVASGQDDNTIYVAWLGPFLGSIMVGSCYMIAPMPSRSAKGGKYRYPLLEPLYEAAPHPLRRRRCRRSAN